MSQKVTQLKKELLDRLSGSVTSYYDKFLSFCDPLKVSVIIVVVHLLYILYQIYQNYQQTGQLVITELALKPIIMMSMLVVAAHVFCSYDQPMYAWCSLLVYALLVWANYHNTCQASVQDRVTQLFQLQEQKTVTKAPEPQQIEEKVVRFAESGSSTGSSLSYASPAF